MRASARVTLVSVIGVLACSGGRARDAAVVTPSATQPGATPAKVGWPRDLGEMVTAVAPAPDGGVVARVRARMLQDGTERGSLVGLGPDGATRWTRQTTSHDYGGELVLVAGGREIAWALAEALVVTDAVTGEERARVPVPEGFLVEGLARLDDTLVLVGFVDSRLVGLRVDGDGRTLASLERWPDGTLAVGDIEFVAAGGIAAWWGVANSNQGQVVRFDQVGGPERIVYTDAAVVGFAARSGGRFELVLERNAVSVTPAACPSVARVVVDGSIDDASWRKRCDGACADAPPSCASTRLEPAGVVAWPGSPGLALAFGARPAEARLVDGASGAPLALVPERLESTPVRHGQRLLAIVHHYEGSTDEFHAVCELGPRVPTRCVRLAISAEGVVPRGDAELLVVGDRALVRLEGQIAWSRLP